MSEQKKPYSKPKVTIITAGSPKHNEIMALLITKGTKTKDLVNIPPPAQPK